MKKNQKSLLKIAIVFCAAVFFITAAESKNASATDPVVLATVNIQNTQIISQNGNVVKIGFDISNRENIQPDIRYGIQLISADGKALTPADEKIFSETLVLNVGESIHREIEYTAPSYLSGKFQVWILSKTSKSLPLGQGMAGEISLSGSGRWLEISRDACYLTVEGESPEKKYPIWQGVDINPTESLVGHCDVQNHFPEKISFGVSFETKNRGVFGDNVTVAAAPSESISMSAGEKKALSFSLPRAIDPQAYDAILVLVDPSGKAISNSIPFHYVMRGASATIQNILFDKDLYSAGDTAKISFDWTPSADSHSQSWLGATQLPPVFLDLVITNSQGDRCADPYRSLLVQEKNKSIQSSEVVVYILKVCADPKVAASIVDGDGKVLDALSYSLKRSNLEGKAAEKPVVKTEATSDNVDSLAKYILIFFGLLLLGSIIFIVIKQVRSRRTIGILFFITVSSLAFCTSRYASADTFTVNNLYCDMYVPDHCFSFPIYSVNLNKTNFSPGESAIASSATIQEAVCNDGGHAGSAISVTIAGTESPLLYDDFGFLSGAWQHPVEMTGGNYAAVFTGHLGKSSADCFFSGITSCFAYTANYNIPYKVISAPCPSLNVSLDKQSIYIDDVVKATAVCSDGANLPSTVIWGVNQPAAIAGAVGAGQDQKTASANVTGKGIGDATITANVGSAAGSTPVTVNKKGICKSPPNNQSYCAKTDIPPTLCEYSNSMPVLSGIGPWNWTCLGTNTISSEDDINCQALKNDTVVPKCGTADGQTLCSGQGSLTWCSAGNNIIGTPKDDGFETSWQCQGSCPETSMVNCSAKGKKSCGWVETNP